MTHTQARIAADRAEALAMARSLPSDSAKPREVGPIVEGIALPNEDPADIGRRFAALGSELRPTTELGRVLVRRVAMLSLRLDRGVAQETATLADRVRRAQADFRAPEGVDPTEAAKLRAEAGRRAMFDPSEAGKAARQHEAATERSLFRALKELRQIDRDAKAAHVAIHGADEGESLASFLEMERMADEMESRYPERTSPRAPSDPGRGRDFGLGGMVDVPITIGRPR